MKLPARILMSCLGPSSLALCGAAGAVAGPIGLNDGQLDGVTAGAIVASSVDAQAVGALALTTTESNSFATRGIDPLQPGLGVSAGAADGTATAVGTNVGIQNGGPTGAATSVQTGGAASGNQVINTTTNYTLSGAGGVVFQAGWTFVYGAWTGL